MILGLLLGTIAVTTPAPAARGASVVPARAPIMVVRGAVAGRASCRYEFGTASLVQRVRVCHTRDDWRLLDARRRARRLRGA